MHHKSLCNVSAEHTREVSKIIHRRGDMYLNGATCAVQDVHRILLVPACMLDGRGAGQLQETIDDTVVLLQGLG